MGELRGKVVLDGYKRNGLKGSHPPGLAYYILSTWEGGAQESEK